VGDEMLKKRRSSFSASTPFKIHQELMLYVSGICSVEWLHKNQSYLNNQFLKSPTLKRSLSAQQATLLQGPPSIITGFRIYSAILGNLSSLEIKAPMYEVE